MNSNLKQTLSKYKSIGCHICKNTKMLCAETFVYMSFYCFYLFIYLSFLEIEDCVDSSKERKKRKRHYGRGL